jgi:hypothetical protein
MDVIILMTDSSTGFRDLYPSIYNWDGYLFNIEGDEVPEEFFIPYGCVI